MTRFLLPLVGLMALAGCTLDTGSRANVPPVVVHDQAQAPMVIRTSPVIVHDAIEDFDVRIGDRRGYREHREYRHYDRRDHRGW